MDLDVSNYLQSLRELNDKRLREDEQLARSLEEDIRKRKSHTNSFYSHFNDHSKQQQDTADYGKSTYLFNYTLFTSFT